MITIKIYKRKAKVVKAEVFGNGFGDGLILRYRYDNHHYNEGEYHEAIFNTIYQLKKGKAKLIESSNPSYPIIFQEPIKFIITDKMEEIEKGDYIVHSDSSRYVMKRADFEDLYEEVD